jgi:hypothetical protein
MIDDTSANGTVTYLGGASTVQNYLVGADFHVPTADRRGKLLGRARHKTS